MKNTRHKNCSKSEAIKFLKGKTVAQKIELAQKSKLPHATSPEILELLASDKDYEVRLWTAVNGSTPDGAMRKLAVDKNGDVRAAAADYINLPVELLEVLASDKHVRVRSNLAENINGHVPKRILEKLADDERSEVRRALLESINHAPELFIRLLADKDESVRRGAMEHRMVVDLIADKTFCTGSIPVRTAFDLLDNMCKNIFDALASDENVAVISGNENHTPPAILEELASDKAFCAESVPVRTAFDMLDRVRTDIFRNMPSGEHSRRVAADNKYTPSVILGELALDESEEVRYKVAGNWNTPAPTLEKLAADKDREVRISVAINLKTPRAVLEKLIRGKTYQISAHARRNLEIKSRLERCNRKTQND